LLLPDCVWLLLLLLLLLLPLLLLLAVVVLLVFLAAALEGPLVFQATVDFFVPFLAATTAFLVPGGCFLSAERGFFVELAFLVVLLELELGFEPESFPAGLALALALALALGFRGAFAANPAGFTVGDTEAWRFGKGP